MNDILLDNSGLGFRVIKIGKKIYNNKVYDNVKNSNGKDIKDKK